MYFRDAVKSDLYAIVELLADDALGAARERFQSPLPKEYLDAFDLLQQQLGNRLIVVVNDTGQVRGCLQLTFTAGLARRGASRATIEGVRICADDRGIGLGTELFEYAISEARKFGCSLVQLTTDRQRPDAHRFYERLGFEPSHIGMKLKL